MGGFSVMKVLRALLARLLFALHSCIALWRLYMEDQDMFYWLFGIIPILLFVEGAVTILLRNGDEYKWFCPCVFIYLCGSIPPIWFLELTNTRNFIANLTRSEVTNEYIQISGHVKVSLPRIRRQYWLQVVEQSLLIVVIVGRWILPKGRLSRDQLSQLLLAYLAISSDIVELFDLFNESIIRGSMKLSLLVLTVWTVALVQFPLVVTTVKGQKARYTWDEDSNEDGFQDAIFNFKIGADSVSTSLVQPMSLASMDSSLRSNAGELRTSHWWGSAFCNKVCRVSIWGIVSTVLLQDGPFLGVRLYLIFYHRVMSYTMIFFVCKNSLIVSLQLYRLLAICSKRAQRTTTPVASSLVAIAKHKSSAPARVDWSKGSKKGVHSNEHNSIHTDKSSISKSLHEPTQHKNSMICSMENYDDLQYV